MSDDEIKVLLTADTAQLKSGMDAGAASVAESTAAMKASIVGQADVMTAAVDRQKTDLALLFDALAGNTKSVEALAEQQAALSRIQEAGSQPAETLADATAMLTTAAERLGVAETAATVAVNENSAALAINGGVAREVGVMIGELARGNYTRLEGSTITLANRTGLLSSALGFIISPLGLATAATAALGIAAYEAAQDEEALHDAIINTGSVSGYSVDQLQTMVSALRETGATAGQAREAVLAVAASGKILGANFQNAAQAAVDMAQLTGVSITKAVEAIGKLQEDPVKSIMKLNETMNFLSPAEATQIRHLEDIGDKAGSAALAIATLTEAEEKRVKMQRDAGDGAESFTGKLKEDLSSIYAGAKNLFGAGTLKQQLDDANAELANYSAQEPGSIHQDDNNQIIVDKSKLSQYQYQELNKLLEKRTQLEAQITAENEKQQQVSGQVAATKATVNQTLSAPKVGAKSDSTDHEQTQADRDAYNEMRLQHTLSLANEKDYWQKKKDAATAGTQEYRQAVQQLLTIKDKEATVSREAMRKEVSEAKQAAAERVSAEKEVEREKQQAAEKARQLSLENLKAAHDETTGEIANKRQQYDLEYSEGTISAQQLLQLEQGLVAQKLAADTKYYRDKEKLEAGDKIAFAKDEAGIIKAQQSAHSQMLANEKQFHKNSEKEWKNYSKKIEGAMQGAINGMLFQHQTLRQGVANIAMVMGEDFIQQAVMKPLTSWIEGEAAKVAASFATHTAVMAQDKVSAAAEITKTKASIARSVSLAGANGVASFAAAPWPVDIGAPAFGAGMALAAGSYSMASAAGGWDRVPFDGAMTELHRNEMVLPATVADHVRNSMGGKGGPSGGAGGNHFHIQALDTRSFKDTVRRNEATFAKAMVQAHRRGHFNH